MNRPWFVKLLRFQALVEQFGGTKVIKDDVI